MRLAQLARKLAIRPTVIVEFLTKHNIQIDVGSNTRLEDDHVALIMQKFAPAMAAEVAAEIAIEKEVEVAPIPKETAIVITQPKAVESIVELALPIDESKPEEIELIKASKVELSGLKVLGKLELAKPKKKESAPVSDLASTTEIIPVIAENKPQQENRKPYPVRKEIDTRPRANPIALQREREATEKEKKKRANVEREKEKRTQHYLNKVKTIAPTKALKLVKEEVEEMISLAPVPKTVWGKFMKWLNT